MGGGEREAIGGVEGQRSGEGLGHSILDKEELCMERGGAAHSTARVSFLLEKCSGIESVKARTSVAISPETGSSRIEAWIAQRF